MEVLMHGFYWTLWNLLKISRVFRSETWLTVYRALYSNTEALWGGQGVFVQAAMGTVAKRKIINIWNCEFNFPNFPIKFKNV